MNVQEHIVGIRGNDLAAITPPASTARYLPRAAPTPCLR